MSEENERIEITSNTGEHFYTIGRLEEVGRALQNGEPISCFWHSRCGMRFEEIIVFALDVQQVMTDRDDGIRAIGPKGHTDDR